MTPSVQFLFDFGSPNAYLCHKVLPALEKRTGIAVQYIPVLLGGLFKLSNNRSPLETTAQIPNKRAYDMLEMKRFIARHGITDFRFNPFFPVNTLSIMRSAAAAEAAGCLSRYVGVMFSAMWEQGRNLSEASEVLAVLNDAGLDAKSLFERSLDPDVKSKLMANTQNAFERGAFGSPTFFVGHEMYFGKDRLLEVELKIVEQQSQE
ncbi:MAG: 2-hydroxychromene-2-carboxylate isomerase [Polaromonas sp.]